ncbi:MAG: transketolase [Bacteroidetes bacterium]|nr:transketolase [Bacteroidota bacterium]
MKDSVTLANNIRKLALIMNHNANASHIGGALSIADILAVLYERVLKIYPEAPANPLRDRFLLSKGHACSALYAVLALKGYFEQELLDTYSKNGSKFITHASHNVPGVELSTGSLGHALSVGCGIALAAKRRQKNFKTYVLVSDGELDEGSNWEAILFAPHHKLDKLTLIVDYNKIQSLGRTDEVLSLEPLKSKFESCNWNTQEIDGHDHEAIYNALVSTENNDRPKVIIAHTVKGKGVDFMEDKLLWHYKSPDEAQLKDAIDQLI